MIGTGEGIALAGACFAAASVGITALKQRGKGVFNSVSTDSLVFRDTCEAKHAGIERELAGINQKLNILIENSTRR